MARKIADGWRDIAEDIAVYTEDGTIMRAIKDGKSAGVYRWSKKWDCWVNACPLKYDTFRRGWGDRHEVF